METSTPVMDDNDLQVARVDQIASTPDQASRNALIGEFLRDYNTQNLAIAKRLHRRVSGRMRLDEAALLVQEVTYDKLSHAEVGEIRNWAGWLTHAVATELPKVLDAENVGGMSKTKRLLRRRRSMWQTRIELAKKLGYDPDDEQVVAAHNERIRATQANPERHGDLAKVSDLQPVMVSDPHESTMCTDMSAGLVDVVCAETVDAIVDACAEVDDELACIAENWLWIEEGVLCIEDSPTALAEAVPTKISARRAKALLAEAKAIAARVVLERAALAI